MFWLPLFLLVRETKPGENKLQAPNHHVLLRISCVFYSRSYPFPFAPHSFHFLGTKWRTVYAGYFPPATQCTLMSGPDFSSLFMCGVYIIVFILPMSKFGPSWHFLKFFSHWRNNSFHVLKGSLPIPRQVDLSPGPMLKTEQQVFDSWRTPQLMTSFSYHFLLLNLNPDPVFDLLFEHDLLTLTLNSLKWNSI